MTLDQFIATKPKELRIGQYFVITYMKSLRPSEISNHLFQLDGDRAKAYILDLMEMWQWPDLPPIEKE